MSPRDRLAIDAFAHTVRACSIPRVYFDELAEGCRMDFTIRRYATWKALEHYCYRVAGVVGLMMCRVFGLKDERALEQAVQMGNAMQLTNILRDVAEDWDRGRLYLPADDLARFGLNESAIAERRCDAAFVSMMRFQIERARALYAQAAIGLRQLPDDGSRLTACVMAVVYAGILRAIERQDCNVFAGRAHLTTRQKLLRVHQAWQLSQWTGRNVMPAVF
jgi:phytoene synthase